MLRCVSRPGAEAKVLQTPADDGRPPHTLKLSPPHLRLRADELIRQVTVNCAERGLVLRTDDPTRLRQRLYQARVKLGDPKLEVLQFSLVELGEGRGKGNFAILKCQLSQGREQKREPSL